MTPTKEYLSNLHSKVFSLFRYQFDNRNYGVMEDWRSHAESVKRDEIFTDDCDGFAFTVCELLLEMGVSSDKVLFIVCETETGEGHAVAGCEVGDVTYILENRYRRIYDWKEKTNYKWNYFMKFDNPGQWYEVTNN